MFVYVCAEGLNCWLQDDEMQTLGSLSEFVGSLYSILRLNLQVHYTVYSGCICKLAVDFW